MSKGHFPVYRLKICLRCNKPYRPTGGRQKYCWNCRPAAYREMEKKKDLQRNLEGANQ